MKDNYTRYPRTLLWLVRDGDVRIGGLGADTEPAFEASVGSFYLSKSPITNEQYAAYDPSHNADEVSPGPADAAVGISFEGAAGYCAWYAAVSRKPMRLPTEVEWEYACRGGSTGRYFFGDDVAQAEGYIWDRSNSGGCVQPPGRKKTNEFGLQAMLGGVWEWTASLYRPYPLVPEDGQDAAELPGTRVLRGGSFREDREQMGCAIRRAEQPNVRHIDVGFRVARSL